MTVSIQTIARSGAFTEVHSPNSSPCPEIEHSLWRISKRSNEEFTIHHDQSQFVDQIKTICLHFVVRQEIDCDVQYEWAWRTFSVWPTSIPKSMVSPTIFKSIFKDRWGERSRIGRTRACLVFTTSSDVVTHPIRGGNEQFISIGRISIPGLGWSR